MRIYMLRHGEAEDPSRRGTDEERQLTETGRKQVMQVARAARRAGVAPALIISSPYIRAIQSAEIAAGALDYAGQIARSRVLQPDSEPKAVWDEIRAHRDGAGLLFVGHEPLTSRTVAYLLAAPSLSVKITTGTMVCLETDPGAQPHAMLRWMITPEIAG